MRDITNNRYREICVDAYEEIVQITEEYNKLFDLPRTSCDQKDVLVQPFYRGQANSEWDIEPSILHPETSEQRTDNIEIPKGLSLFGTIAYIQHYCTGTRFIDFTISLDTAIYFACNSKNDKDGAVFIYCYAPHKAEWYSAIVLSELERTVGVDKINVQCLSERIMQNYPDIKSYFNDIQELNGWIISFLDHGFIVLPDDKSIQENLRLERQRGCFYMCGVKFDHNIQANDRNFSRAGMQQFYPKSVVVPNDLKCGRWLVKIVIPKEKKPIILQQLSDKGITYDYLFPDDN